MSASVAMTVSYMVKARKAFTVGQEMKPAVLRGFDLLIRESWNWLPAMLAPLRIGIRTAAIAVILEMGSERD